MRTGQQELRLSCPECRPLKSSDRPEVKVLHLVKLKSYNDMIRNHYGVRGSQYYEKLRNLNLRSSRQCHGICFGVCIQMCPRSKSKKLESIMLQIIVCSPCHKDVNGQSHSPAYLSYLSWKILFLFSLSY